MSASERPLLPVGSAVAGGQKIVRRLERKFFVEVLALSDGRNLYVSLQETAIPIEGSIEVQTMVGLRRAVIRAGFSDEEILEVSRAFSGEVGLAAVAGMSALKEMLLNDVVLPLRDPDRYRRFRVAIPHGILLFGPPGCGKTYIVRRLAEELRYFFTELRPSSVATPYVHGAVSNIAAVFDEARARAPSIVFIDEIEALLPRREELSGSADIKKEEINEFLLHLNNAGDQGVLVVGATNRPQMIDTAILRAGRMDKRIPVPPPDFAARNELFKLCLRGRPIADGIDTEKLARLTENYVSADIELIVNKAARGAIKANSAVVDQKLLEEACATATPSVSAEEIASFRRFASIERW